MQYAPIASGLPRLPHLITALRWMRTFFLYEGNVSETYRPPPLDCLITRALIKNVLQFYDNKKEQLLYCQNFLLNISWDLIVHYVYVKLIVLL